MEWLKAVEQLRDARQPGVLVTVASVRGHAPREPGRRWSSRPTATWGTVGGGNLEAVAIARARELLDVGPRRKPELLTVALSDKAPYQHGVQCCGGEVTLLLEPLPVVPAVAIFGMGHVGLELARILARHDLELHLVDSRAEQTGPGAARGADDAVARVHVHHVPVLPELVLAELPPGAHVLIMTHDHAEDAALCDAALRARQLGSIGLIGSAGKWARFRRKLADEGHSDDAIGRITTPIGLPDITGKDPATIAVSVAADLRPPVRARPGGPPRPSRSRPDDALPGHGPRHARRPVHRRRAARRGRRGPCSCATARSSSAAASPRCAPAIPARTSSTCAADSCCPASSTPTCTSRRSARSAGSACRCWTGSSAARCPRRPGWPTAAYAEAVAREFVAGLAQAGTTTALVFGAHFAPAVDALFTEAARVGLRVTSGLVVSDRAAARRAADHTRARLRRGPRAGEPVARRRPQPVRRHAAVRALLRRRAARLVRVAARRRARRVVHLAHQREPPRDRRGDPGLFDAAHYLDTYDRHGLVGRAHRAGAQRAPDRRRAEAARRAGRHRRALPDQQLRARQRALPAEAPRRGGRARRARLRRRRRHRLLPVQGGSAGLLHAAAARRPGPGRCEPAHLLHLATAAGADALGLADVGDLGVGKRFDALWLRPRPGTTLDVALRNANGADDALAKAFALACPADVERVWVEGEEISRRGG